ncbi:CDP-alcohol phosphatidyltransferase family protein [Candidatus Phytoplasma melaleucae]|uniref:CDP-alcohol phosphatidyltransferase family protein n=1 Tax=Candidatus Phytoplasma melaleucae TaxID=2982630 RepID=A0ABT9DD85_9MOLU|nr:CDP-alcohol phosphatidyltransferase family protein ['Melaleuca sp.' phytoplasma]MDO8168048.1 CDP-alcohol phosphatidyltransferase family protein ['Melaleuca sp.' phytoplasma]
MYNYTVYMTYLNLLSGFYGIIFTLEKDKIVFSCICLSISGILDILDGIISRSKKKRSVQEKRYGVQIDSLADLVSFGMLPVFIGLSLFKNTFKLEFSNIYNICFLICGSLYILASLIRLAYFNIRSEVINPSASNTFIGIPVTISSVIYPLLVLFYFILEKIQPLNFYNQKIFLFAYIFSFILLSFLFVCDKIKFKKPTNIFHFILFLLLIAVALIALHL